MRRGESCQGEDVNRLRRKICSMGTQKKKEERIRVDPANSSRRDVKNEAEDEISALGILQYKTGGHSQSVGGPGINARAYEVVIVIIISFSILALAF